MGTYVYVQNSGHSYRVECDAITTIGRDKNNKIVIKNPKVSRNHAIIRRIGNVKYHLIDCDSANGSYLDGDRIHKPTLLKNGCKIKIGSAVITFVHGNAEYLDGDSREGEDTLVMTAHDLE